MKNKIEYNGKWSVYDTSSLEDFKKMFNSFENVAEDGINPLVLKFTEDFASKCSAKFPSANKTKYHVFYNDGEEKEALAYFVCDDKLNTITDIDIPASGSSLEEYAVKELISKVESRIVMGSKKESYYEILKQIISKAPSLIKYVNPKLILTTGFNEPGLFRYNEYELLAQEALKNDPSLINYLDQNYLLHFDELTENLNTESKRFWVKSLKGKE